MIHTEFRKTSGFTLTELLVVIGIMAVMMALLVPATRSLTRGNRVQKCSLQLQQIGNALKAYHLDYRGVPPRYPADSSDPDSDMLGPGLVALWELDYLRNRRALHCPNDKEYQDPNEFAYYLSYMDRDLGYTDQEGVDWHPKLGDASGDPADPYEAVNDYKYLSTRGIMDSDDLDYKRQLEHPDFYGPSGTGEIWHPDDTTVVAWCNLHTKHFIRQGETMYQVLFWDGSVGVVPARFFTDDGLDPPAAWRVHPSDTLDTLP